MQITTTRYQQLQASDFRPLAWQLRASFDKNFDDDITFFTLDTSLLDGIDVLAPNGVDPVQSWDKYDYADYSDRAIQLEWERSEEVPFNVSLAIADIQLNNYDGLFTAGGDSPLEPNLLPQRPFRILAGFGYEVLPQFVGLSQTTPEADYKSGTASLHCVDFLASLFDKPLDQTVMYENIRSDEALDELFQLFGLLPSQFSFEVGSNVIKFLYFPKGTKLGDAVRQIVQAELGSFYMDEMGVIRFKNSKRDALSPVAVFDKNNIIEFETSNDDNIINVVEVTANVREVQAEQPIYSLPQAQQLPSGSSSLFFAFNDPVTYVNPSIVFTANSLEDGSGTDITGSVTITDIDVFATAIKVTFSNATSAGFLTEVAIDGTPAKAPANPLYGRYTDQDSIDKYDEQVLTIENDFIQDQDTMDSVALTVLYNYAQHSNTIDLTIKGDYALQIRDTITVQIDDIDQDYAITKISNVLALGSLVQRITARVFNIPPYFILSSDSEARSLLDGTDLLAP